MGLAVGISLAGLAAAVMALDLDPPPPAPPASPAQTLRVVVRTVDETDQKVLARLRGHASDLSITFVVDADGRPSAGVEPPAFTDADALAASARADAVVWFSHARCGASDDGDDG